MDRISSVHGVCRLPPWGSGRFIRLLHGKPAQLIGNIDVPHTHTYIPDFGKALVILGERSEADGQAWHVPNDHPRVTQREMVRMIARDADVEPKMSAMGKLHDVDGRLVYPGSKRDG